MAAGVPAFTFVFQTESKEDGRIKEYTLVLYPSFKEPSQKSTQPLLEYLIGLNIVT